MNRSIRPEQIRRLLAITLASLLFAPFSFADKPRDITGTLTREQSVSVLRLGGDARQRGYTHGYLMAEQIRELCMNILVSPAVWGDVQRYEREVRMQAVPLFSYSPDEQAELQGMIAGMRARFADDPSKMRLETVSRDIDVFDLMAANIYADLQNGACTSFAAWGPATKDGNMIVGRNLDFPRLPGLAESQLLIVYNSTSGDGKRWVSLSWPGMIGAYTAMNEDGVFVSMHDVRAPTDWAKGPFVPRSIAIRHIMENIGAQDTTERATQLLRKTQAFCGNNFMVAAPFAGQPNPAVVLEYDADKSVNEGVTVRTTESQDHQLPENTISCTNHFRDRGESIKCSRYFAVRRVLKDKRKAGEAIDVETALLAQQAAAVHDTLHTMIAEPNAKRITFSLCTATEDATKQPAATFELSDLFVQDALAKRN